MATSRRRKGVTVIERLRREPYNFAFYQAVRLIERAVTMADGDFCNAAIAGAAPPSTEFIRFSAQCGFSFVGSDVLSLERKPVDESDAQDSLLNQWQMEVGFTGLIGSQGVMPYYLTELVQRELRENNTALRDFLNLFNHRHISLLYQAWSKYQLPVNYERQRLRKEREPDLFTQGIAALAGLGTSEMRYRMPMPDEALLGMAGHYSRGRCSAAALTGMIKHYFGLSVTIEQFQGQWDALPRDILCRLPCASAPAGVNNCLGKNTILGTHCFQAQNKFRVIIEPMVYEQFMMIAPGTQKLETLKTFIKFSAGIELDFELLVTLPTNQVPPVQLNRQSEHAPLLGWNTYMVRGQETAGLVEITLSAENISPDEALPSAEAFF
ncbi:type VI secretion system baseplate subunit TssG [Microbulbifer spongiae]|uniref:Type VI secretion system baseplate subunit TssG n=1 Tax=Microbulbifer spongiae TaxID=2944933 RepID=A0ABY9ECM1_9GAMM|nr:type VI secretion system baseplate subunit TssG [Microbulbifer sp. MI-G]WKD50027.1 type VI secretion system baseplate subunit TssG [Microbulbifer sp. MI-G]